MRARYRSSWMWLACLALACGVFLSWPDLDLKIALEFYDQAGQFPFGRWVSVRAIYVWAPRLGWVLTVWALLVLVIRWHRPERISRGLWRKCVAWILVAVLGNGLLVHEGLKNQVGRPRPSHVQEMGGTVSFVPALHLSQSCQRNCSFVSGHAALGFCFLAFGMWAARERRRRWMVASLLLGGSIGLVRIVQGGHFLSDIVFSFLAIWGTVLVVRQVWLRWRFWRLERGNAQRRGHSVRWS
jgi:lipid A 4'-phosphatase